MLLLEGHGVVHARSSSVAEQCMPLGASALENADVWNQQVWCPLWAVTCTLASAALEHGFLSLWMPPTDSGCLQAKFVMPPRLYFVIWKMGLFSRIRDWLELIRGWGGFPSKTVAKHLCVFQWVLESLSLGSLDNRIDSLKSGVVYLWFYLKERHLPRPRLLAASVSKEYKGMDGALPKRELSDHPPNQRQARTFFLCTACP